MKIGKIVVNWGSMYSGKTEELLRQIKRAKIGGKPYLLFKSAKDNRYSETKVQTHTGENLDAIIVKNASEILEYVELCDKEIKVIGIDEGQFFDEFLIEVCIILKHKGIDIFVSGLDMKYNGEPFEVMMKLAAIANETHKFKAVCVRCGEDAYISHRIVDSDEDILVGSNGMYQALCESCYMKAKFEVKSKGREE